jgi:predicted phosphodiesterase
MARVKQIEKKADLVKDINARRAFEPYKGREEELCIVDFSNADLRRRTEQLFPELRLQSLKPIRKIFIFGDVHVPFHDKKSLLTTLLYAKQEVKPDEVIILGDFLDFKSISSYIKELNERDLTKELLQSAEILKAILELFDSVKRVIYIEANHEERLYSYINKHAPELGNLFKNPLEILEHIKHELPKDKILYHSPRISGNVPFYLIGKRLSCIHGHEYHKGSRHSVINVARTIFQKAQKSILFGHWHVTQEYTHTTIDRELRTAWSVGCLCNLAPEWNPLNQWNHGFAVVYEYEDGFFTVYNKKIIQKGGKAIIV